MNEVELVKERVVFQGKTYLIQIDLEENYIKHLEFAEILGGGIYCQSIGGWNAERKNFCRFQMRLYPPYNLLTMQLTPSMDKHFDSKSCLTSADRPATQDFTRIWALTQLCSFHSEFMLKFGTNTNQTEMQF